MKGTNGCTSRQGYFYGVYLRTYWKYDIQYCRLLISNNFRIWDPAKLARHKIATPMIYGSWIWVVELLLSRSNIIEIIRIVRDDVAIGIDRYSEILVAFYLYVTLAHEKLVYWWHLQKLDHILIGLLFFAVSDQPWYDAQLQKNKFWIFCTKINMVMTIFESIDQIHATEKSASYCLDFFSQKKKRNWLINTKRILKYCDPNNFGFSLLCR